ncbi:hypothetical protein CDO52_07370 [Nocardiopsis gilva YIM 90087]|uniref:Uncharacterized protein n=2 Tax=Nocardiopsis gilva TaxID=280236 RepID=A0A223S3H3_9ACTN|nr:hypothetical protein [Nocardiopsis gilva]ASU82627.1 hypothetical protein CDO52_07370 [Nocardiopsis gilva YIM 90087]
MPGTLIAARIMMFILGGIGLVLAGSSAVLLWGASASWGGRHGFFFPPLFFLVLFLVTVTYAVTCIGLAALMGRRRSRSLWILLVILHGGVALLFLWGWAGGEGAPSLAFFPVMMVYGVIEQRLGLPYFFPWEWVNAVGAPLLFVLLTVVVLGLLFVKPSRVYYRGGD